MQNVSQPKIICVEGLTKQTKEKTQINMYARRHLNIFQSKRTGVKTKLKWAP